MKTLGCIRVLVVDSSTIDRKLLLNYLANIEDTVLECDELDSMDEAIEQISHNPDRYDLVILDLRLANAQGLDILKQFSKTFPNLPYIIVSTYGDDDVIENALNIGAHDYLIKGQFTVDRLARAVRFAINREQVRRLIKQNLMS